MAARTIAVTTMAKAMTTETTGVIPASTVATPIAERSAGTTERPDA